VENSKFREPKSHRHTWGSIEKSNPQCCHYRNAFPDLHLTIEDVIAEGETVMTRWSCRGTHKGDLNGIAPTGKHITITGITVARVSGGKIVEGFVNWDAQGLMQQLGVVPATAQVKVLAAAR